MKRYRNLAGDSGVRAYDIGAGSITVRFDNGATYVYTEQSTGRDHVAEMQRLAETGRGLSSYISREVGDRYARRLDT